MKLKPLLLVVPFLFVFCGLFLMDNLVLSNRSEGSVTVTQETEDAFGRRPVERGGQETEPITCSLVVGNTGSLKEGGGEVIRQTADENGEVVAALQYHCAVLEAEQGIGHAGWVCVDLSNGKIGYIKLEAVERCQLTVTSDDPVRMKIVTDALKYLGLPFVRYGTSLESGADCSNFIQQIYALSGVSIPDTPNEQRNQGTLIREADALPGDLVYYPVNDGYGHVALYLGDGFMINCSGHSGKTYPSGGARICRLQYKDRERYQLYRLLSS